MGENSKIGWTDHTQNFWVGCTKVSAACDFCYAETWAKRSGHPELWDGDRRKTKTWSDPRRWDYEAAKAYTMWMQGHPEAKQPTPPKVFTNSLSDFFDNQVPIEWRREAWHVIDQTPYLKWLILTKRPQNIRKMLPEPDAGYSKPWGPNGWPNVWLGMTAENQEEYDRRAGHLFAVPALLHFISYEPALGPLRIGWEPKWVICGGESGAHARPMNPQWARDIRNQCEARGVPFFMKQWGEWAPALDREGNVRSEGHGSHGAIFEGGKWTTFARGDRHGDVFRLGKKAAGRLLDGVEHNGMPT